MDILYAVENRFPRVTFCSWISLIFNALSLDEFAHFRTIGVGVFQALRAGGIVCLIASLFIPIATGAATTPKMSWPEATGALVDLRPKAISCAQVIRTYGSKGQVAAASLDYADAKSDVDAAIAALMVGSASSAGDASIIAMQGLVKSGGAKLEKFCAVARSVIPGSIGQKAWVQDLAKASIEPLIKAASDGIAALYTAHRKDDELTRQSIQTQLKAAKWPTFSEISAPR